MRTMGCGLGDSRDAAFRVWRAELVDPGRGQDGVREQGCGRVPGGIWPAFRILVGADMRIAGYFSEMKILLAIE